jgi:hypothetical protein
MIDSIGCWLSENGLQIGVYLAGAYLVFYQAVLKQLGSRIGDLPILKQHTRLIEEAKQEFSVGLEEVKSQLSRENIAHQVNLTEYVRRRFDKLECAYSRLLALHEFAKGNLFSYDDRADFDSKIEKFDELYCGADRATKECALYVEWALWSEVINLLNNCYEAHMAFRGLKSTSIDEITAVPSYLFTDEALVLELKSRNMTHLLTLHTLMKEFPAMTRRMITEARKPVTEIVPWPDVASVAPK